MQKKGKILTLGGDHSVTYPIIKAYSQFYSDLNILQFDAHPDLYHEYAGNPYSHGCPFARIMEKGFIKRLVQVGIRAMTSHQKEQAERFGVEIVEMKDFKPDLDINFTGPVYISLDLDGLDPAFAPGVSHQEPGGRSAYSQHPDTGLSTRPSGHSHSRTQPKTGRSTGAGRQLGDET